MLPLNQTHLLVLVGDGNASDDHRLTSLLERRHSMDVEPMTDPKWQRLNFVLGLENVITITFLGKELAVGDDGATCSRGSRRRKGIGMAEAKAEKESDADEAHVELKGGRQEQSTTCIFVSFQSYWLACRGV